MDLLVLVHRARPGDLLDLTDNLVQVVLVDPRVEAFDRVTKAGLEYALPAFPDADITMLYVVDDLETGYADEPAAQRPTNTAALSSRW
ncbi:hypothetical protein [Natronolimnobius sp. AArcel1]|uniref:hypothetical protein n=1 Tax=Natronolimnobius sp. AArcel1 TaxID=1679093 RepID=UPI0031B6F494